MADLSSKVDTFDGSLYSHELQDIPEILYFSCKYMAKKIYCANFTIKSFSENDRKPTLLKIL
jgi:phage gp36-like protein